MRNLFVAALLASALLAGCSSNDDARDGDVARPLTPAELYAPIVTPVVHRADGRIVDASAYPGELPVFAERTILQRGAGEPTIAVTSDGVAIYPSIAFDINAQATSLASTHVYATSNEGLNWTDVTPMVAPVPQSPKAAPTSLDPYVYADPVTDRLFNLDLNLAYGAFLSWSDDGGQSWTNNPNCCGMPVDDHQTLFAGPATTLVSNPALYPGRILYYCINQVAEATCTKSLDGGLTWGAPAQVFRGLEAPSESNDCNVDPQAPEDATGCVCGGLHGHGHASEATGTVFLPKGHCGRAWLGRSDDNGVTFDTVLVDNTVGFDGHEAIVSTDRDGNVYYFFLDGNALPRLAVSTDDGRTWGAPMNVTAPGVTAAKFPSVVAGEDGHVAFLYLGTTNPNGTHVNERTECTPPQGQQCPYAHPEARENQTWNAFIGFSLDATAVDPVFATVTGHDAADPLHRGDCSGRCQVVGGGMYDFLDIDVRPDNGQVWAALVDNCNGDTPYNSAPCNGPEGTFESYRRAQAAVAVQVGGTMLGTRLP